MLVRNPDSVVVIGNFDGVHRGHQALLARAQAEAPGLPLIVVTFWPHPRSVAAPGTEPPLLTDLDRRIELLKQAGAHQVRVIRFTREFMKLSPADYVENVLLPLSPRVVVVGENFTFGSMASGTPADLERLARGRFTVVTQQLIAVDDTGTTCSSRIREELAAGEVAEAQRNLGHPFRYTGVVVQGHQRGRELGFPTANVPVELEFVAPAAGVYAGWLTRLDEPGAQPMPAAISVGLNPTFDDVPEAVVEAHVLDRTDLELYGVKVAIDFVARLRGNVKFEGLPALIEQMHADVVATREVLGLPAGPQ